MASAVWCMMSIEGSERMRALRQSSISSFMASGVKVSDLRTVALKDLSVVMKHIGVRRCCCGGAWRCCCGRFVAAFLSPTKWSAMRLRGRGRCCRKLLPNHNLLAVVVGRFEAGRGLDTVIRTRCEQQLNACARRF